MNYIINYINYLNQHEVIYVETNSLEECLDAFKKIIDIDEEQLPEKYEIYQLVYKNEL